MWWKTVIQNSYSSLSRSRKIALAVLLCLALLLYLWPSIFKIKKPRIHLGTAGQCVGEYLYRIQDAVDNFDAVTYHIPLEDGEKYYSPYVGNGKHGISYDGQLGLHLRVNRSLSVPIKYSPIVKSNIKYHHDTQQAVAIHIAAGLVYHVESIRKSTGCVTIESELFAHRSRPSVLVQDITISNPTNEGVSVNIDQPQPLALKGYATVADRAPGPDGVEVNFQVKKGIVEIPDSKEKIHLVVAMVTLPGEIIVPKQKTKKLHILTVVHFSTSASGADESLLQQLQDSVIKELKTVLLIDAHSLKEEHTRVWDQLWQSGFGISYSKADGHLNGDRINTTLYYVLSNTLAPLHDHQASAEEKESIRKVLYYPDRCYGGHSTLQMRSSKLWQDMKSEAEITAVVNAWMITLDKQGCAVMIKAGAEGVLQAMLLSFGAIRFASDHFEIAIEPKDLHRDYFFRRINYGNNTHVNISIEVDDDNKANLYVALDRNDRPYYACDAGCIDPPAPLSKSKTKFPVKLTDPITSILYVTADKKHMEDLKHSIHVHENKEAPAHEHHVIALHKHGHHFGGLPTLFWVSIAFLIGIFHLFLFKLIYNEYCQNQDRFTRGKYNL